MSLMTGSGPCHTWPWDGHSQRGGLPLVNNGPRSSSRMLGRKGHRFGGWGEGVRSAGGGGGWPRKGSQLLKQLSSDLLPFVPGHGVYGMTPRAAGRGSILVCDLDPASCWGSRPPVTVG